MCKLCGNDSNEHPPGCCNYANLVRMAYGGEPLPSNPLEMGVKPIPSKPVDFLGLDTKDPERIEARREKVDKLLEKYQKGD